MVMPGQRDGTASVGAVQRPAGGDAVAVGGLVEDADLEVGEDRAVERDGAGDAVVAVEVERVDVVDEVLGVEFARALEVPAGADLLECFARVVGLRAHRPSRAGTRAWAAKMSIVATSTEVVDSMLHWRPSAAMLGRSRPAAVKKARTWVSVKPSQTSACSSRIQV